MVVNWPEIGVELALVAVLLALVAVYVRYRALPKLKTDAAQWVGAAIGRFMQNLAEQAEAEEGGGAVGGGGGLNLGGFQITPDLLRTGMQLLKMAQDMGFLKKVGGGGGGENPFLK